MTLQAVQRIHVCSWKLQSLCPIESVGRLLGMQLPFEPVIIDALSFEGQRLQGACNGNKATQRPCNGHFMLSGLFFLEARSLGKGCLFEEKTHQNCSSLYRVNMQLMVLASQLACWKAFYMLLRIPLSVVCVSNRHLLLALRPSKSPGNRCNSVELNHFRS